MTTELSYPESLGGAEIEVGDIWVSLAFGDVDKGWVVEVSDEEIVVNWEVGGTCAHHPADLETLDIAVYGESQHAAAEARYAYAAGERR